MRANKCHSIRARTGKEQQTNFYSTRTTQRFSKRSSRRFSSFNKFRSTAGFSATRGKAVFVAAGESNGELNEFANNSATLQRQNFRSVIACYWASWSDIWKQLLAMESNYYSWSSITYMHIWAYSFPEHFIVEYHHTKITRFWMTVLGKQWWKIMISAVEESFKNFFRILKGSDFILGFYMLDSL